jgi:cell shape-determining protein MreC
VLARVGETVDSIVKLADKTFVRLVSKTIEDVQSSRKQKEAERIQKEEQARKARAEEEERQYRASRMDDEVLLVSLDSTAFRMKLRDLPSDV